MNQDAERMSRTMDAMVKNSGKVRFPIVSSQSWTRHQYSREDLPSWTFCHKRLTIKRDRFPKSQQSRSQWLV